MKTIGLIGGMSWESSSEYYKIINETYQLNKWWQLRLDSRLRGNDEISSVLSFPLKRESMKVVC